MRKLLCYAEGREGAWEAICLDLDIAVQGRSFQEVDNALRTAIDEYIETALQEDEATSAKLLSRKAPFGVRLRSLMKALIRGRGDVRGKR